MKVLVTGGAGFIASHIVDAYVQAGHEVAVVDDLSSGKEAHLNPGAKFYRLDICDAGLEEVFRDFRPEAVNHHAAQMSVAVSVRDPELDARINVLGTVKVMECAVRCGVRKMVFASSGGTVYGEAERFPVDETAPLEAVSPYGVTKIAGEYYLRYYASQYGIHYTILRYSNVYGPRQNPHGEAGAVAIFCQKILAGEPSVVFGAQQAGDEGCVRDYVFVEDVVRANLLALAGGDGEVLNIGTGVGTATEKLFDLIAGALGFEGAPEAGPPREGDLLKSVLDASRAGRVLGWRAEVLLREGIARTVAFFKREVEAREEEPVA